MASRSETQLMKPRRALRPVVARAALLTLLLQLFLPFAGLGQLQAKGPGAAPFVICTGAGFAWINPDGTPAGDPSQDRQAPEHRCPVCALSHIAATAILPATPALALPVPEAVRLVPITRDASSARQAAPPLPARGPPAAA